MYSFNALLPAGFEDLRPLIEPMERVCDDVNKGLRKNTMSDEPAFSAPGRLLNTSVRRMVTDGDFCSAFIEIQMMDDYMLPVAFQRSATQEPLFRNPA